MLLGYARKGYSKEYAGILSKVQQRQVELSWRLSGDNYFEKAQAILPHVEKFVRDENFTVIGYSQKELQHKIVCDLVGYSVLTDPLNDPNVEGININSWEDINVTFRDGTSRKIDGFSSPQHGIDIIKRLLLKDGKTIDDAEPLAEASIDDNIRIEAAISPIVPQDVGCACYIRKLSKKVFSKDDYLLLDFCSEQELDLLSIALLRGISILLVGKVNTGKTTFLAHLLSTLPDYMQIGTIESGAHEMNLVKKTNGFVKNNVVHLISRERPELERQNITQEKLVAAGLRFDFKVMSVAEMRNHEAHNAQEASLTGIPVISTVHAGSPEEAHRRVAALCRKKYPIDYQTALIQAATAFPVVVFINRLSDGKRRIIDISESIVNGTSLSYRPLFHYEVRLNENGQTKGVHKKRNSPSDSLIRKMRYEGVTDEELEKICGNIQAKKERSG